MEDVIPILKAAFCFKLDQLLSHCIRRIAQSDLDNVTLQKELPHEVVSEIKFLRLKSQNESREANGEVLVDPVHEKRKGNIHKALDSDDVELVKLLIKESNISLDGAYALHYAAAYCDSKIFKEVLCLDMADINLKNPRGYTVLHVAARRKEPSILVALLSKGACALQTTSDGQTAGAICRRLTRPKDYYENTERGKESNKDRICIDVLEREMAGNSTSANISVSSQMIEDDLHMKLLYLENRGTFIFWCYDEKNNQIYSLNLIESIYVTKIYQHLQQPEVESEFVFENYSSSCKEAIATICMQ